uniref:Thoeris protein ThsB TIR-like domain-containing protein n=1 Tax=Leptospirillum sp. Group II '5-way CG' TaxID=419541 RepID=B6ALE9_9BACT|nr:MAG: Hypothetical protein CGL2_11346182 [Leptospirillum sp. Group II '5-way CG']
MSSYQIHIFISHSWSYSGHYDTLSDWIFGKDWSVGQESINFMDFSVPKNDPIHNAPTKRELKEAIYAQIARSHVIVIPTGMYASYSEWIKKEIDGSKTYSKPILAVEPWGQQRSASVVGQAAKKIVGWNSESVVNGIWSLYREK